MPDRTMASEFARSGRRSHETPRPDSLNLVTLLPPLREDQEQPMVGAASSGGTVIVPENFDSFTIGHSIFKKALVTLAVPTWLSFETLGRRFHISLDGGNQCVPSMGRALRAGVCIISSSTRVNPKLLDADVDFSVEILAKVRQLRPL